MEKKNLTKKEKERAKRIADAAVRAYERAIDRFYQNIMKEKK